MTQLFNLVMSGYVIAFFFAVINLFVKRRFLDWAINSLLTAASMLQLVYIIWRWHEAGRPPFSNMFESLVLFAWATVVVYLVVRVKQHVPVLGVAAALLATVTLAYASSFKSDIEPLVPALRSNWLTFHVFTCFLGYSGFAISFIAAIAYLIAAKRSSTLSEQPARNAMESVMTQTVAFGFIFLTIGIITGAVWANSAWGTYWSWDPKETWSLITWFIYAAFLHCRYMRGWSGRRAAWLSIVGFLSVLFTYIGVNFLLSGLHSYA
jgi:cytochrome c-type biogenesis protein CcsB